MLTHRRLGHPSFLLLKEVYPQFFGKKPLTNLILKLASLPSLKGYHIKLQTTDVIFGDLPHILECLTSDGS